MRLTRKQHFLALAGGHTVILRQGPFSGSMLGYFRRSERVFSLSFFVYMEVQARNRPPEESRVVLGNPRIAVARGTWHRFYVRRWSYLPSEKKRQAFPQEKTVKGLPC